MFHYNRARDTGAFFKEGRKANVVVNNQFTCCWEQKGQSPKVRNAWNLNRYNIAVIF